MGETMNADSALVAMLWVDVGILILLAIDVYFTYQMYTSKQGG